MMRYAQHLWNASEHAWISIVAVAIGLALLPFGEFAASIGLLVMGVTLLINGGDWLVLGSVAIARRIGWPSLVIGLTIVALGTSAPELAVNIVATFNDNPSLVFGNVVGSNIANIGMVLGVSAVIVPLAVTSRVVRLELPILLIISVALLVAAAVGPQVTWRSAVVDGFGWQHGAVLLVLAAGTIFTWWLVGRRATDDVLAEEIIEEEVERALLGSMDLAAWFVLLGIVALVGGGKLAEQGAVGIAGHFGVSNAVIGLTVVAIATSLPELSACIAACRRGHTDLAVGNVVGSNIFNIVLVMGLSAALSPVAPGSGVPVPPGGWTDMFVMLAFVVALVPMGAMFQRRVNRFEGVVLVAAYLAYMVHTVVNARSS